MVEEVLSTEMEKSAEKFTTVDDNNPSGSSDVLLKEPSEGRKQCALLKMVFCTFKRKEKKKCTLRGKSYILELPSTSIYLCLKNLRHLKRMYTLMWTEHSALSKH